MKQTGCLRQSKLEAVQSEADPLANSKVAEDRLCVKGQGHSSGHRQDRIQVCQVNMEQRLKNQTVPETDPRFANTISMGGFASAQELRQETLLRSFLIAGQQMVELQSSSERVWCQIRPDP